jgi:hypothetical protein
VDVPYIGMLEFPMFHTCCTQESQKLSSPYSRGLMKSCYDFLKSACRSRGSLSVPPTLVNHCAVLYDWMCTIIRFQIRGAEFLHMGPTDSSTGCVHEKEPENPLLVPAGSRLGCLECLVSLQSHLQSSIPLMVLNVVRKEQKFVELTHTFFLALRNHYD